MTMSLIYAPNVGRWGLEVYVQRAVQLVIVGALFWAVLFLGGKVAGPDPARLGAIGQAARDAVVGVADTARAVIAGPEPSPTPTPAPSASNTKGP